MHVRHAIVFSLSLLMTLLLQWRGDAYRAEWTEDADEPAHYVTGLMVRDYIASGFPGSPMQYALNYYDHYPKVGLGHWPPVFYIIQASWTLLFGVSRTSLLVLMAMLGAAWLTFSYAVVRFCFPAWMASVSVILLACTPQYQSSTRSVMAEIVVALLALLALHFLARYLDRGAGDWRDAVGFSAASLATVLTKGTGIALLPVPLLSIVAARKWRLLASAWLWAPAALAAAAAAVWFVSAPDALHDKVARFGAFGIFRWYRIGETFTWWFASLGILGSMFAAVGFVSKVQEIARRREMGGLWIIAVLFLPVSLACRVLFGPWELRHLLTTLPLLMLFLWHGVECALSLITWKHGVVTMTILAVLSLTAAYHVARMRPKRYLGLDRVAWDLAAAREYVHNRLLIVSDSVGEGVFIAEVASREKRPGHVVNRSGKVLEESSFMGDRTHMFFQTPEELLAFFEKNRDWVVVVDGISSKLSSLAQVREMIRRYPERWQLVASYPGTAGGGPIQVVRMKP